MSTKTAAYNIVSRSFNILSFLWVLALFPLSAFRSFKYGTIQCILHPCCSKDLLCTCLFAAHYSRAIPLTILLKYPNKLHCWRGFIFKGFSKRKLLCLPITFLSKNTISNINFPPVCVPGAQGTPVLGSFQLWWPLVQILASIPPAHRGCRQGQFPASPKENKRVDGVVAGCTAPEEQGCACLFNSLASLGGHRQVAPTDVQFRFFSRRISINQMPHFKEPDLPLQRMLQLQRSDVSHHFKREQLLW